jgi:hypothetical protein
MELWLFEFLEPSIWTGYTHGGIAHSLSSLFDSLRKRGGCI